MYSLTVKHEDAELSHSELSIIRTLYRGFFFHPLLEYILRKSKSISLQSSGTVPSLN